MEYIIKHIQFGKKYILYESKDYLINHTTWFTNLIKSIIEYTHLTKNVDRIKWLENTLKLMLNNNSYRIKNVSCFTLMCSRKCKHIIDFDDILEIFEYIQFIIKKEESILEIYELKNIILLCTRILFSKIINKIHTVIPLICNFYNNLFEYETINLDTSFVTKLFDVYICKYIFYKKNYNSNNI